MTEHRVEYLIDTNILVEAQKTYPRSMFPQVWNQLSWGISQGIIHFVPDVIEELKKGNDDLVEWISSHNGLSKLKTRDNTSVVQRYIEIIRFIDVSPAYNDKALRTWSDGSIADPWLIAAALCHGHTIVTYEKPARIKGTPCGKPKIPDICKDFNVCCITILQLLASIKDRMDTETE